MVLSHLCHDCSMDFTLAHCNFGLRGESSDKDELFVRELAKKLKVKIHVKSFNTDIYANQNKVSVQMAARDLRYQWFKELMAKNDCKSLVTAHHADDDLETFLINLSRGTGIKGLTGIPSKTAHISRPLLSFSRTQIETFAHSAGYRWREDESNTDTKYLRNKIRHEVVPLLKELHPAFLENFKNTQEQLQQTAQITEGHLVKVKAALFEHQDDAIQISIQVLQALEPTKGYIYGLFNEYGFTSWKDIFNLLTAMSGKEVRSKTHRLLKDRDYLLLSTIVEGAHDGLEIEANIKEISTPIRLAVMDVDQMGEQGKNILYVDKETLKYPLRLRKWQKGDYFYPMGMQGKKKLSKYFKDERMSVIAKEGQWLLCSEEKIVWVVGKRADERFKVTNATQNIVRFTLNR